MGRVELDVYAPFSSEVVRNALLDFSPRRPDLWPSLDPDAYEVYEHGETSAVIREGSRMGPVRIWARERYDWSRPDTISWTVEESNFCTPGSRVIATLSHRDDGTCDIHIDWERTPTRFAARMMLGMVVASKGKPLRQSLEKAFDRWNANNQTVDGDR